MVTDEQLIERLRSGMHSAASDVTPPYELLDGVSPASRRAVRLPGVGGLVPGLATASAIARTTRKGLASPAQGHAQ